MLVIQIGALASHHSLLSSFLFVFVLKSKWKKKKKEEKKKKKMEENWTNEREEIPLFLLLLLPLFLDHSNRQQKFLFSQFFDQSLRPLSLHLQPIAIEGEKKKKKKKKKREREKRKKELSLLILVVAVVNNRSLLLIELLSEIDNCCCTCPSCWLLLRIL